MAFDRYGFAVGDQGLKVEGGSFPEVFQGLGLGAPPSVAAGKTRAEGMEAALIGL